jgi:hypothetical protein
MCFFSHQSQLVPRFPIIVFLRRGLRPLIWGTAGSGVFFKVGSDLFLKASLLTHSFDGSEVV